MNHCLTYFVQNVSCTKNIQMGKGLHGKAAKAVSDIRSADCLEKASLLLIGEVVRIQRLNGTTG